MINYLLIGLAILFQGVGLSPDEFERETSGQKNVQVLDVRTPAEYQTGHLKAALQADWNNRKQFEERTKHLDPSQPVYVYCLSGARSASAAEYLLARGYTKVFALKGGMNSWKRAGKPVEAATTVPQTTPKAYEAAVARGTVTLVDFGAEWCPPCRKLEPVLADVVRTARPNFVKMDGGIETDLMRLLGVSELPTLIVYKNGKESWRRTGLVTREELLEALK